MERQYIGARYVPKFFENPNTGDSTWLSGVEYEPLTIVTLAGNSYTSKKPVPAGIGSPNANPNYWAPTGIYNAQVNEIREDLNALSEDVDGLQTNVTAINTKMNKARQFILVGDSFGGGVDGNNNTRPVEGGGWIQRFANSVSDWAEVYNNQVPLGGVYGFASSRPFLDVLMDAEQSVPDKTLITDIVVLGGSNDIGIAESSIKQKIAEFVAYCHTNYPKARVAIGCLGSDVRKMVSMGKTYSSCVDHGAEYISDLRGLYCLTRYIGIDNIHLTREGYEFYTPYINQAILTGFSDWKFSHTGSDSLTLNTNIFASREVRFEWEISNKECYCGITGYTGTEFGIVTLSLTSETVGLELLGSQNAIRLPVQYSRIQTFISPTGQIIEAYPVPNNYTDINVAIPSGIGQTTFKSGVTLTHPQIY